jgi:tetratricopeptide (TPR) repeat protein
MNARFLLICSLAGVLFAQDSWMTKGVNAYRHAKYAEAIQNFEHAVTDDPESVDARISLALGYLAAYLPSVESHENRVLRRNAEENLLAALAIDPRNLYATLYLAQFYFDETYDAPAKKEEKLNQAQKLYQKAAEINPNSKEAFYALGAIAWHKSSHRMDEAIRQFDHALQIDPDYVDAMDYLAAIQREKGDEAGAAGWSAKARKIKQARDDKWRAAHPNSNPEKPCPSATLCFDPDSSHDTLPLEWPPAPVVFLPVPPPPVR